MKKTYVLFEELGPDVRHFDQATLRAAVVAGDPEAFAELMRRYEPVLRQQMLRAIVGSPLSSSDTLDEMLAEFWCALLDHRMSRLRAWQQQRGTSLGAWLGLFAWQTSAAHLRELARHARLIQVLGNV